MFCRVLRSCVLRLSEQSTFTAGLPLSARPDVGDGERERKQGAFNKRGRDTNEEAMTGGGRASERKKEKEGITEVRS